MWSICPFSDEFSSERRNHLTKYDGEVHPLNKKDQGLIKISLHFIFSATEFRAK